MSQSQDQQQVKPDEHPPELVEFATLRGRPVVFLFLQEPLAIRHLGELRAALGDQQFEELDLVIHSGGGDIHVAYQMVELMRMHTQRLFACVPLYAKSAATLICLGADEIVMEKLAQLGPLDTQVFEERGGKADFTSALNPFKALEQLQAFSLGALNASAKMFVERSDLSIDECIKHAINFVIGTTSPLFSQLDPEKLGEYSRALAVCSEYGDRLLRRYSDWDAKQQSKILEELVHGYPAHDYIIDFRELQELGLNVKLFANDEREAISNAVLQLHAACTDPAARSLIRLVEPAEPARKTRAKDATEE